jgi:hypothetical protein
MQTHKINVRSVNIHVKVVKKVQVNVLLVYQLHKFHFCMKKNRNVITSVHYKHLNLQLLVNVKTVYSHAYNVLHQLSVYLVKIPITFIINNASLIALIHLFH